MFNKYFQVKSIKDIQTLYKEAVSKRENICYQEMDALLVVTKSMAIIFQDLKEIHEQYIEQAQVQPTDLIDEASVYFRIQMIEVLMKGINCDEVNISWEKEHIAEGFFGMLKGATSCPAPQDSDTKE